MPSTSTYKEMPRGLSLFALFAIVVSIMILSCAQPTGATGATDPGTTDNTNTNPVASLSASIWYINASGKVFELSTGTDPEITGFDHSVKKLMYYDKSVYYLTPADSGLYSLYQWSKDGADRVVNVRLTSIGVMAQDGYYFLDTVMGFGTSRYALYCVSPQTGAIAEVPGLDAKDPENDVNELYSTQAGLCYQVYGTTGGVVDWAEIRRLVGNEASGTGNNDVTVVADGMTSNGTNLASYIRFFAGEEYGYYFPSGEEGGAGITHLESDGTWKSIAQTDCFDGLVPTSYEFIGTVDQANAGVAFPVLPTLPVADIWYEANGAVYACLDGTDTSITGFDKSAHRICQYGKSLYYLTINSAGTGYCLMQWKRDSADRVVYDLTSDINADGYPPYTIVSDGIYYRSYSSSKYAFTVRKFTLSDCTDLEVLGFDKASSITGLFSLTDCLYYSTLDGIYKKNGSEASCTGTDDVKIVSSVSVNDYLNLDFGVISNYDGFWYSFGPGNWGLYKSSVNGTTLYSHVTDKSDDYFNRKSFAFVKDLDQNDAGITIAGLGTGASGDVPPISGTDLVKMSTAYQNAILAASTSTDPSSSAYSVLSSDMTSSMLYFNSYVDSNGVSLTGSLSMVTVAGTNFSITYNGTITVSNDGDLQSVKYVDFKVTANGSTGSLEYMIAGQKWIFDVATLKWSKGS